MHRFIRSAHLPKWTSRLHSYLTLDDRISVQQPWALAPGPAILLVALAFPYRWMFFLAYAWLVLVGLCYVWVRMLVSGVRLERVLHSSWAEVGDSLEETWTLHNASMAPLLWLEIDDASTMPGYSARRAAATGPRETQSGHTFARCSQRGLFTLGPLALRLSDPLGIFLAQWRAGSPRQIVVYPPLVVLPPIPAPKSPHGGLARAELLQLHVTPNVGGLREYVPGDQPGRIHWPTVARTQRLMIKEFDQERAGAIWIVLDLYAGAYTPVAAPQSAPAAAQAASQQYTQSSLIRDDWEAAQMFDTPLELAIVLASSLAANLLAEGRSVGLIADDGRRHVVTPDQGARQLWRILPELVDAGATGSIPLARLLDPSSGMIPRRQGSGALAVITPDRGGAWVSALAGWRERRREAPIVLHIDPPHAIPHDLLARLAGAGARTVTFHTGEALPFVHPPKPRTQERVSPLGRIQTIQS